MVVTLEVSQPEMSALKFFKSLKSSRMSVMAETHQSAMGPYFAMAEAAFELNSVTAVFREALVVKMQGGEGVGGDGGGGGGLSDGGGGLGDGGGGDGDGGGGEGGGGDVGGDSLQTASSSPARYPLSAATSVSVTVVKGFAWDGSLAICSSVVLLASGPNPHANTVAGSALTLFAASTAV